MAILKIPKILIPNSSVDMQKWATVACDQFCAEPKYWRELAEFVGSAPSTLKLTLPEIYLNSAVQPQVDNIIKSMSDYVDAGIFTEVNNLILVERTVGDEKRVGIMIAIDLDSYDWHRVNAPIRATEDTLVERLPVRIQIRKDAPLELPHAMVLIDDKQKTVIEPIFARRNQLKKLYETDLNMNGGHIIGYEIDNSAAVISNLLALMSEDLQKEKYGANAGILLAVGDGNHSIASAKVIWEELKPQLSQAERETHPARFALVEVVNIYGGGMTFSPIHRVIFNTDEGFAARMKAALSGNGSTVLITDNGDIKISIPEVASLAITALQEYIELEVKNNSAIKVEYVHNLDRLRSVIKESGGIGIAMPIFPEDELFNYVVNIGNLPKKSFSIGEPEHKRYYLEAKYIKTEK